MKKTFFVLTVAAVLAMWFPGTTAAQDTAQEQEDNTRYSYGSVISIEAGTIVIEEYDYDTGETVSMTYIINHETVFENAASYSDIAAGDDVSIEYIETSAGKIALVIEKDTPWAPDEEYSEPQF
jgi:hypothetical protein